MHRLGPPTHTYTRAHTHSLSFSLHSSHLTSLLFPHSLHPSIFPTIRLHCCFLLLFFSSFIILLLLLRSFRPCLCHVNSLIVSHTHTHITLFTPTLVGVTVEWIRPELWGRVRRADRDTVRSVSQWRERAGGGPS